MFINIGMNLGIMPIVGLPLPFISYGGSSLISLLILAGIMENIIIKSKISLLISKFMELTLKFKKEKKMKDWKTISCPLSYTVKRLKIAV